MKRKIVILIILFTFMKLYSENLSYEDFIVKERNSKLINKTYYLGQIQKKLEIQNLLVRFKSENLETYAGYNNVLKLSNDDIDLYYIYDDFYKLVEIKIKSSNYYLFKSNLSVGDNFTDETSNLFSELRLCEDNTPFYHGEMDDPTFNDAYVVNMNISIFVTNKIINSIILYFTYNL